MTLSRCSICKHPDRLMIEEALATGGSLVPTAKAFEVSKSALHRHQQRCASPSTAPTMAFPPLAVGGQAVPTINLPAELLAAMQPIGAGHDSDALILEVKLRHLNAIFAYGLSRAVAKDDVPSILRSGRAMQKLFQLDLLTAPQRIAFRAQSQIDPIWRLLGEILDVGKPTADETPPRNCNPLQQREREKAIILAAQP